MNENRRRAVVWETIERNAFRPPSEKESLAWLGVYARTLHSLWELEPQWNRFGLTDEFDVPFLNNLKCRHVIESPAKFSISLYLNATPNCLHWDVDPSFHSKASLQICTEKYPKHQMSDLPCDVEAVLDGMFFHPRCHIHLNKIGIPKIQLNENAGGLSSHEIRIGLSSENPFVFLFHLRYQFCLLSNHVREKERQRLIDLFCGAIRDKLMVRPRELFNL